MCSILSLSLGITVGQRLHQGIQLLQLVKTRPLDVLSACMNDQSFVRNQVSSHNSLTSVYDNRVVPLSELWTRKRDLMAGMASFINYKGNATPGNPDPGDPGSTEKGFLSTAFGRT